ncbi:right-handed parallel beta-helix repeat-containing protein [Mycolicibacterium aichiense]|uniref:right-handed parallel beta-helix repeat-containing protein n=1 Tax=Mycolicibacterium aichiense TaxID=1799 RepID=UPI0013D1C4BC|nr:right-handed parallel beta-helix repeat-containing protein [Mycolicibacterium aichiense]
MGTVVNHVFNSAFDVVGGLPGGPLSDVLGGALVLVRRSLFFVPEGVSVAQTNSSLVVSVNSGSVAYIRQVGSSVQISGDPGFFRAYTVSDASAVSVSVSNAGNAGCAGVVVTSGTVNGALSTSGIDALRFADGAAFSGRVDAVLGGGALHVRDAVRGLGGVRLDAAVVLDSDVEVDAGQKEATFVGTVDAARAGWQSLTVTALTTTRFEAAVGGRAALAALLTRGIAPLSITESTDTKTIPLHYLPTYNANGQPQVKYGIDVAIGNNASQIYEFDTGGTAFFAGYNPSFWQNVPLSTTGLSVDYSSGNFYNSVVSTTPITLGTGSQTVTTQPIQIGAILSGGNSNSGAVFDFTNPLAPPVESNFFGDFGASFAVLPVTGLSIPMTSPLFQLPGNLSSGFLVQLGPIGTDPQLSMGVTDALRDQFTYAIPVAQLIGSGNYPVSGYPILQQFGFFPQYFAQDGTGAKLPIGTEQFPQCASQCLPTLIDSGAPTTGIRLKDIPGGDPYNVNGQLKPGVSFIAEFPTTQGRTPLEWKFTAGDTGSVDLVQYEDGSVATNTQNVNTGLTLYNYYDVMFDVQDQVIWLRPNGGESTVSLNSVTTTGNQTYQQKAILGGSYSTDSGDFSVAGVATLVGDTVINAGNGDVTFSGTVDGTANGQQSLTVNSSGATAFVRQVGSNFALKSLVTDAGGSAAMAAVTTTKDQTYNDSSVSLSGPYRTTTGNFLVGGNAELAGPASIQTGGPGTITLTGTVDAQPGRGLTLKLTTAGGGVHLGAAVGAQNPLGGLVLASTAGAGATTVTADGVINLDGSLGFANQNGLAIGPSVTVDFSHGGLVQNFTKTGIVLDQSDDSTLQEFIVSNNATGGIVATDVERLTLADNAVIGNGAPNGGDGIDIAGGIDVHITGNSVIGNNGDGIAVFSYANPVIVDSQHITLKGNAVTNNTGDGIDLKDADDVEISGNTITTNTANGVLSLNTDNAAIETNTISGNGEHGVTVDKGTANTILSNAISVNVIDGISLQNGGNANQAAPTVASAAITNGRLIVTGSLTDRSGDYRLQVFYSPPPVNAEAPPVQGLQLLSDSVEKTDSFTVDVPGGSLWQGSFVTVTATVGDNTSEFSVPVVITVAP